MQKVKKILQGLGSMIKRMMFIGAVMFMLIYLKSGKINRYFVLYDDGRFKVISTASTNFMKFIKIDEYMKYKIYEKNKRVFTCRVNQIIQFMISIIF